MQTMLRLRGGLVVALACLSAPARADVIVVDLGGDGDFTSVANAVGAAQDGDIVLVRPGDYTDQVPPFSLDHAVAIVGKSLTLVGDTGGDVRIPDLAVRDVPTDGTVLLRNLTIVPRSLIATSQGPTLSVAGCEGAVFVEDCEARGLDGSYVEQLFQILALPALGAVLVSDSQAVSFHRCRFTGGDGADTADSPDQATVSTAAGRAAAATGGSRLAFYDCVLTGGTGGTGILSVRPEDPLENLGGSPGGDALALFTGSVAILSGTVAVGGPGGDGCSTNQAGMCSGGAGVACSLSVLQDLDVTLTGGPGGVLDDGAGVAADGQDVELFTSTRMPLSGAAVGLVKTGPLRTGELGNVTVTGPPGRLFALFIGFDAGYIPLLHFKGAFIPGLPIEGPLLLELMPPGGVFSADYLAPDIAPFGLEGLITVDQVFMDQGVDGVILSAASSHVQVEAGS